MPAKHLKARHWVAAGIFNDLPSCTAIYTGKSRRGKILAIKNSAYYWNSFPQHCSNDSRNLQVVDDDWHQKHNESSLGAQSSPIGAWSTSACGLCNASQAHNCTNDRVRQRY